MERPEEISKSKEVQETKCTCQACGHVWFYGKSEQKEQALNKSSNEGKALLCCSGCWPTLFMPDKKVVDLDKCSKCNSKAVKKEIVTHHV